MQFESLVKQQYDEVLVLVDEDEVWNDDEVHDDEIRDDEVEGTPSIRRDGVLDRRRLDDLKAHSGEQIDLDSVLSGRVVDPEDPFALDESRQIGMQPSDCFPLLIGDVTGIATFEPSDLISVLLRARDSVPEEVDRCSRRDP